MALPPELHFLSRPTSRPSVEKLFHETGPWWQEGWGPLWKGTGFHVYTQCVVGTSLPRRRRRARENFVVIATYICPQNFARNIPLYLGSPQKPHTPHGSQG